MKFKCYWEGQEINGHNDQQRVQERRKFKTEKEGRGKRIAGAPQKGQRGKKIHNNPKKKEKETKKGQADGKRDRRIPSRAGEYYMRTNLVTRFKKKREREGRKEQSTIR